MMQNTETGGAPVPISDNTFDSFVKENKVVLVDAWAPWCGPCRMLGPTVDQIAKENAGKVAVGKLNVDDNRAISTRFRIMSIPTMLVFKDGKLVETMVGALPKDSIMATLNRHMD